jgi:hypothetical protein
LSAFEAATSSLSAPERYYDPEEAEGILDSEDWREVVARARAALQILERD